MQFDATEMLKDLEAGSLMDRFSVAIHEVAKSVVHHGDGKRKGKVILELSMEQIKNASQVNVQSKLQFKQLTGKGDMTETRMDESPMYVDKTGVSVTPNGQIDFIEKAKNTTRSI